MKHDPAEQWCICGHKAKDHAEIVKNIFGGPCKKCPCDRYTWTPKKPESKK